MPEIPVTARCLTCNYALRGLSTPRCPECGRAFDPADPKTINLGRTPGRIGRFLLRRSGWPPIVILLIATGFVLSATRWPQGGVILTSLDLLYYFNSIHLRPKLLSYTDWAYTLSLLTAAAVVLLWLMKIPLREIARRVYRQPIPPPVNMGRRIMLGTIAIFAMGGSIAIGWPYRIARAWVRQVMQMPPRPRAWGPPLPPPPVVLTEEQKMAVLRAAVVQLPNGGERLTALQILVEDNLPSALPILLDAIRHEKDSAVLTAEIRLAGMFQDGSSVPTLLALWDHPNAEVRAAVTDAIGWIHAPAFPMPSVRDLDGNATTLRSTPAIRLDAMRRGDPLYYDETYKLRERDPFKGLRNQVDHLRPRLESRLVNGQSLGEREAAARSLLRWQSGYHLRAAEWGVWVCVNGKLELQQSIMEEIPPFVHRTGEAVSDLKDRVHEIHFSVTKPIIHITSDRLMVLDVQVLITDGRPWFAFPRPDDFTLSARQTIWPSDPQQPIEAFDRGDMARLDSAGEGYPWLEPAHRYVALALEGGFGPFSPVITAVGVRWQSVVVSPQKLGWMQPPEIPGEPKFSWWNRLRQVPCSWVSNLGDTERFLYYDGPTAADPPLTVRLDGSLLTTTPTLKPKPKKEDTDPHDNYSHDQSFEPIESRPPADGPLAEASRRGVYVKVDGKDQSVLGCVIDLPGTTDLSKEPMLTGDALIARLHSLLTAAGLTDAEAAGLVDCWRPQFFQTPGSRFILLMSAYDYDRLCPIRIDPPPTELVRVGLVLTEFGTGK